MHLGPIDTRAKEYSISHNVDRKAGIFGAIMSKRIDRQNNICTKPANPFILSEEFVFRMFR